MTPSHRRSGAIGRRGVLGLAALAALPAAALGYCRATSDDTAPTGASPDRSGAAEPPAPPAATAAPFANAEQPLGGVVPFVPGKALLGSYLGLDGLTDRDALRLRNEQLGRKQKIVHVFYAWPDRLPSSIPYLPKTSIPMVSWRGTKYADILSGDSDDLIAAAARRLKALDRPTLLRWGWEMNGDWYAWGGYGNGRNPQGYIDCYRRLRKIFDKQGAENVSWVWSPNWNSSPAESWNRVEAYYPGDKYVDWVGVSGYNLHEETPETLFDPVYQKFCDRKPIMIAEVGSMDHGDTSKADWIKDFAGYVAQRPAIGAVAWFDTDTHESYPERWRVDTDPASLAAYRALAKSARFAG